MADAHDDGGRLAPGCEPIAGDGVRSASRQGRHRDGVAPSAPLLERLRRHVAASYATTDGSHDLAHIERVWRTAERLAQDLACDDAVLAAACWFHDCVAVEKNSPDRANASRLAAEEAARVLASWGWAPAPISSVFHAIHAHSYSAGVPPQSNEAMVLRDADRLDAIGAIGIARTFYVGGRLGSALYHPGDPGASGRPLDDTKFALDHFEVKLFLLERGMLTQPGRREALQRTAFMRSYIQQFRAEIGG